MRIVPCAIRPARPEVSHAIPFASCQVSGSAHSSPCIPESQIPATYRPSAQLLEAIFDACAAPSSIENKKPDSNGAAEPAKPARTFASIRFIPNQGTVLWCDLRHVPVSEFGGKIRPIVVVSPAHFNSETVYVVPITRAARYAKTSDVHIPADRYHFLAAGCDSWIKTQFVMPVHRSRLDRWRINDNWCAPHITVEDVQRLLDAIATIVIARQVLAA